MSDLRLMIPLAVALFGAVLWLLRPGKPLAESAHSSLDKEAIGTRPSHFRYFAQIKQALSTSDQEYLQKIAQPGIARQVRRERRAVARNFLRGLREDFASLEQLGRMIAALSPVVSRKHETERLVQNLKFQLLYAIVWVNLSTGRMPLQQIEQLTGLVSRLALRMEQGMAQINALSPGQDLHGLNV